MKVAITDAPFDDISLERSRLEPLGCSVVPAGGDLAESLRDADFVLTTVAPIDRRTIEALRRARLIARYGIGVDNVDVACARDRGIAVGNVPDYCQDEVADHALALMLDMMRQTTRLTSVVRGGGWNLGQDPARFRVLRGLSVGLVGFGRIGQEVARRLHGFGCAILVHDPHTPATRVAELGATALDLATLLARSDVVSLHCPSTPQTRGLIDAGAFTRMKRGAILINVARGDVVDQQALHAALADGKLGGAGLDVLAVEPIAPGDPLLARDDVVVTPHIACASEPAIRRLREGVVAHVVRALRGEAPRDIVNGVTALRARPAAATA